MNKGEEFLNLYRDLEEMLAARSGGSRPGLIQDFTEGAGYRYREELNLFREIRNLLSHHGEIGGEDVITPSDSVVEKMREILEFAKNPPAAMHAAVPTRELYMAKMSDSVISVTETMEKRGFSHVPITDRHGVLTGIFSVGTLFMFVRSNSKLTPSQLTLNDLSEFLDPDKHTTEQFAFVTKSASCYKIKALFQSEGPDIRRVAAVFVTSNGKRSGTLFGMITPWDILRIEKG